jgi:predicted cobalt transporter CbtA
VIGGVVGLALLGLFLGVVFGVVFAATRPRLGAGPDWRRARRLAVVGFVTVYLVPFCKYPANPPAVGDPATVNQRTIAYLCLLALSVLAVLLAGVVLDQLRRRGTAEPVAQVGAAAVWLLTLVVAYVALPANPGVNTVPADLLWSFRMASVAGQAAFWAVLGTTFSLLSARADRPAAVPDERTPTGTPRP